MKMHILNTGNQALTKQCDNRNTTTLVLIQPIYSPYHEPFGSVPQHSPGLSEAGACQHKMKAKVVVMRSIG